MSRSATASILSFNGGYVDTMGFVALSGLFTAHVTGNFVTLGATLSEGTGGALAKLLALPVFCLTVFLGHGFNYWLEGRKYPPVPVFLSLKFTLFVLAAALALSLPRESAGSGGELLLGMVLVVAMALQNGLHRTHLSDQPPTTLLTGTTTQIMLDLSDLVFGGEAKGKAVGARLFKLVRALVLFAGGCAVAALLFRLSHRLCFLVPPITVATAFLIHSFGGETDQSKNQKEKA
ncbi:YoaK family protein [Martelella mediterranea]|uniref:Putative membrane protein n=1 Tax=Martelella mediterranea DSM 17316 TaxID=1122214 RepID=A0A1U9Z3D2_9HYPH|nr:putative membrane protein [Martelella mediterranea DSM 17316]